MSKKPRAKLISREDIQYYPDKITALIEEFKSMYPMVNLETNSIQWKLLLKYLNSNLFAKVPNTVTPYGRNTILDLEDRKVLDSITDIYINLCYLYSKDVNLYDYSLFIGMDYSNVVAWENVTHKNADVIKKIQSGHEYIIRSKLHDSNNPTAHIALANNDLGWSTARIDHQVQERRLISRDDIAQIGNGQPPKLLED